MPTPGQKSLASCFSFPQALEPFLAALPRAWLDRFQIHAWPPPIPEDRFRPVLDFWRDRRVAFVRQSASMVGYRAAPARTWEERVAPTPGHPGPLSLVAELSADCFVVRQDSDPETFAWRGKHEGDPDPAATFRKMEEHRLREESQPGVVNCGDVRWEDYDLVVCLDIPVPTRLVRQTRRTLWAWFSIEAGGPLVEQSLRGPVAAYHLFLNHHFRRYRARPSNRAHLVEFPFSFQSRNAWASLARHAGAGSAVRAGIVVDRPTGPQISEPFPTDVQVMGLQGPRLDVAGLARLYAGKKYALRLDPNRRWGNWLVEVVQGGCLFLGRADTLDNLSPLLPGLDVRNEREARSAIDTLEKDPALFSAYRNLQASVMEHVCFRRPLADLTAHARRFFNRR